MNTEADHQKIIRQLNQELEFLAYAVSHDLNAPLRHLDGYSKLLEEECKDNLNPLAKEYLRFIQEANTRLREQLHAILTYSRIGRKQLEIRTVDVAHCLEEVLNRHKQLIDASQAEIRTGTLYHLPTDKQLLKKLISILLSNALQFRHPDRKVHIRIECEQQPGSYLYCVKDNGIGFDPAMHDSMFRLFKVVHTQDEANTGIGSGLALARRITERLGGEIWAESNSSGGSIFFVRLPLQQNLTAFKEGCGPAYNRTSLEDADLVQ